MQLLQFGMNKQVVGMLIRALNYYITITEDESTSERALAREFLDKLLPKYGEMK